MLFHRFQAWNLAHALYADKKIGARNGEGFVRYRFEQGFKEGWLRPDFIQEALEMFVVDEDPFSLHHRSRPAYANSATRCAF
jgi:hypothetical protein